MFYVSCAINVGTLTMLDNAAAVATVLGLVVAITALFYQIKKPPSVLSKNTSYVNYRGHSTAKKLIDSFVTKHGTLLFFMPIAVLSGLTLPDLVVWIWAMIFLFGYFNYSKSKSKVYFCMSVITLSGFGLIGSYLSEFELFQRFWPIIYL